MSNQKKHVVLTGLTINLANVFGPFTQKEAEKFKQRVDRYIDRLWDDSKQHLLPKPDPAVIIKINGPYSWPAKVITGK